SIPVTLDPVGIAATSFRQTSVERLLTEVSFTAIKGNAGEMAHLVNVAWTTRGVDSVDGTVEQLEEIAVNIANKYKTIAIITGEVDIISDGTKIFRNDSGHAMLTKITGAGCLLGSIVTASLAVSDDSLQAAYEAVRFYGLAAEQAIQHEHVKGSGSIISAFLDELQQ